MDGWLSPSSERVNWKELPVKDVAQVRQEVENEETCMYGSLWVRVMDGMAGSCVLYKAAKFNETRSAYLLEMNTMNNTRLCACVPTIFR